MRKQFISTAAARALRRRAGFTLVEVLATLLLLGIALPAIEYGISLSVRAADLARHRSEAAALADSKLNELITTGSYQTASLSGAFDDSPEYSWAARLNSYNSGQGIGVNAANVPQQLDVDVTWKEAGQTRTITASTLVYSSASAGTSGATP